MKGPCLSCAALTKCKKVTNQMIADLDGCGLYEEAPLPEVFARSRAWTLLGTRVLTKHKGKNIMPNPDKLRLVYVRSLATQFGVLPPDEQHQYDLDTLQKAVSTVEGWEDIADRSTLDLKAMWKELKAAPAKAAPEKPTPEVEAEEKPKPKRRGRPRKKPVKAAEEEVQAAAEPEEDDSPAPPKRAAKKPVRRASRRQQAPAESNSSADLDDLKKMVEMNGEIIKGILQTQEKDVLAALKELTDKLSTIEQHLCWVYNGEYAEEGKEISSLSDETWV